MCISRTESLVLLVPLKFDKPLCFFAKQTSWLAFRSQGSDLAWGNISVNSSSFAFLTFEVLISRVWQHSWVYAQRAIAARTHTQTPLPGPPLRWAKVCSSHGVLCSGGIPAAPLLSELPQLHQRGMSGARRGRQKTKNREKEKWEELCFHNHIPTGFQLQRWGRSKQFCLSCFCCAVLSFRGLFCFKLFLFFAEE